MSITEVLFNIMYPIFFIMFIIYPKFELGTKIEQSMIRLTKPKVRLPFYRTRKYLIPYYNDIQIAEMVGMGRYWKVVKYGCAILLVSMFVISTILGLAVEYIHPYLFIGVSFAYWGALTLTILADIIFMAQMNYIFSQSFFRKLFCIIPPVSALLLAYQIPHYFRINKDALSGAFEVQGKAR